MELMFKSPKAPPFEEGKDLCVLILCENATTTHKACDVLHLLGRNLKAEAGRLFYQWWNFEFLAAKELWEVFAAEAAAADMIIIGVYAQLDLHEMFDAWLKRLPELRKMHPGAIIAVLDPILVTAESEPEVLSQIKQVAALSRMDFFATHAAEGMEAGIVRCVRDPNLPDNPVPAAEVARIGDSNPQALREDSM